MAALPDDLSFNNIRKIEFALAKDLTRLHDIANRLNQPEIVSQVDETLKRIEDRRFSVAVVGEFKRGKSTFINALLGKEILPADIVPTSATLNRVTHALRPRVQIIFRDETVEEVPIDQMADYVTKLTPEAEAMAATVKEAVVYYPIPYCENNVHIYDTPGLNDDEAMTAVTLSVLPKVDTAIMVIMPNSPFSGYEGDFLNKLLMNDIGRVMFVVTAIDRVRRTKDRERVMALIRERIEKAVAQRAAEQFGEDSDEYHNYLKQIGTPKLFAISGYDALQAKLENDAELLTKSGFRELETALEKFLSEERGAVTLKVISDRIITFGEQLSKILTMEQGALQMQQQEFDTTLAATRTELDNLRQQSIREMAQIDDEASYIQAQLLTQIQTMKEQMIVVADAIIKETEMTTTDIRRATLGAMGGYVTDLANKVPENLQEKSKRGIGRLWGKMPSNWQKVGEDALRKVSENVQSVQEKNRSVIIEEMMQKIMEGIQAQGQKSTMAMQNSMQDHLTTSVDRVRLFGKTADNLLQRSEAQFANKDDTLTGSRSVVAGRLTTSLSVITELGDLWSGYQFVDLKSGVSSSMSSLGASVNLSWQNMKAKLSSEETTPQLPSLDPITAYKNDYKAKTAAAIERQLEENEIEVKLQEQISKAFAGLKQKLAQEVEESIEQVEGNLEELRQKRERTTLLNERELTEFRTIQIELRTILDKAYQLSDHLLHFE